MKRINLYLCSPLGQEVDCGVREIGIPVEEERKAGKEKGWKKISHFFFGRKV
jgi:hypothetical protein